MDHNENQKSRIDIENLYDIVKDLPGLKCSDILFFAPVYYPIAEISVECRERNYEDFEPFEELILSLYGLNVINTATLSKTLGVPVNYIQQVIALLNHNKLISLKEKRITQKGILSLNKRRKVYTLDTTHVIELDLLNKRLLRKDEAIRNSNLKLLNKTYQESSTYNEIGHLDFIDNVNEQEILNQLKVDFTNLVGNNSKNLLKTPERFNKIDPLPGFKYAPGYMLLIKNFENPIVLVKRFNPTSSNRNYWKPLGVNSREEMEKLKLKNLTLNSIEALNCVIELFNELAKQDFNYETELDELGLVIPFNREGIKFVKRVHFKDYFEINRFFFKSYDPYIFVILNRIIEEGEFLVTRPKYYGQIVSLSTQDPILYQLHSLFNQAVIKIGSEKRVIVKITQELDENQPVLEEIIRILNDSIFC